ncbi:hypothetical protein D5b_00251 [Faustovirus]|nr:hypothetical protein D5b_00251 [Faustovirus]AMN84663.1 hypothetical protein D6_00260 [Faustovirus]AMP44203.1 hypothetical protein PRJ_Dakar_00247 [Faustovirus]
MSGDKIATKADVRLWEKCVAEAKAKFDGKYSARMYQHALYLYKKRGGKFLGRKSKHNSMRVWTAEEWGTASGAPSVHSAHYTPNKGRKSKRDTVKPTNERYLPKYVREHLSKREYAVSSRKKRRDSQRGIQYSREPTAIRSKISRLMRVSKRKASQRKASQHKNKK